MSKYLFEILLVAIPLLVTVAGWFVTYRKQKEILQLQSTIAAKQATAKPKLENVLLMGKWADEGFEIYKEILLLEQILNDKDEDGFYSANPEFDASKVFDRYEVWRKTSENLIIIAERYDPAYKQNVDKWGNKFDGKLPKDLPNLFRLFEKLLWDFIHIQHDRYQERYEAEFWNYYQSEPDMQIRWELVVSDAGKYIKPIYQKFHKTLDEVSVYIQTGITLPRE